MSEPSMSGTSTTGSDRQRLPTRLREAATFALMDAARSTVLEAATEIERLLVVLDCYSAYAAASEREHRRETRVRVPLLDRPQGRR